MRSDLFTSEEYQGKLAELATLRGSVTLDDDPIAKGLGDINIKIAHLQADLERASSMVSEAVVNKSLAQQQLSARKNTYEMAVKRLLVTDPTIKSMRSADLRTAAADIKSLQELDSFHVSECSAASADTFLKCAVQVRNDIEMKNKNLFEQVNVVRMMMRVSPDLTDQLRTM